MIRLSRKARAQLATLAAYYDDLDRPEAVRNLLARIAQASDRIEQNRGPFMQAPRPYPALTRAGWLWLKQGPYWFAYADHPTGPTIQAVFHESANIPERL